MLAKDYLWLSMQQKHKNWSKNKSRQQKIYLMEGCCRQTVYGSHFFPAPLPAK
jgi:hypothetical protein